MQCSVEPGNDVRFDDSLKTVLSADMSTGFGAQSAWRQLVDLMGRGRGRTDGEALARLRVLRDDIPEQVRASSARALAFAAPDAALVGFFAEDSLAIAAPVLRTATLGADDWLALLPRLTPAGRSVLRHRRDLPPAVARGLESFGSTDFVLGQPDPVHPVETPVSPAAAADPAADPAIDGPVPAIDPERVEVQPVPSPDTPLSTSPFVTLGAIARGLPFVAEALRHAAQPVVPAEPAEPAEPLAAVESLGGASIAATPEPIPAAGPERFEISDLVKRIDAFNRDRVVPETAPATPAQPPETFRYETDATGVIRWVEGVSRAALVGLSLAHAARQGDVQIDGVAVGGYRRRSPFDAARLQVGGLSNAAGSWRLSGVPVFDEGSGRFIGFRGTARRPRRDEMAELAVTAQTLAQTTAQNPAQSMPQKTNSPVSDSLRQLVHELRTPTNAIAGFAELIETELLGPIAPTYRDRATTIRRQASDLLAAIDDLDIAARIEGHALDLRPTVVPVLPLLTAVVHDLTPLAALRGAHVLVDPSAEPCEVAGDDRAVERLVSRLLATLVSASGKDETLMVGVEATGGEVSILFDRPRSLAVHAANILLSIDTEREHDRDGAPLLGTGFALRLAQNFATELGGHLAFGDDQLTLRLPAVADERSGRVLDGLR